MARYVMANRRAGKFREEEKLSSREAVENVMKSSFLSGASIAAANDPPQDTARRVVIFEANDAEAMTSGMEQLNQAQHKAAEVLYQSQQASAAGAGPGAGPGGPAGPEGPGAEQSGAAPEGDVIDAEVVDDDKK